MQPRRFVFNYNQPVTAQQEATSPTTFLYSAEPIVELEELPDDAQRSLYLRHEGQAHANQLQETLPPPRPFDFPLEARYRAYRVTRRFAADQPTEPLGNHPARLAEAAARRAHTPPFDQLPSTSGAESTLYLFNVLVALEWLPSRAYLESLAWGFRRASDLLYDSTNGAMAFGQVVFGDARWMDCADIQMLASNRILPRSWVSGLLIPAKYTPIRVGRGVWTKRRDVAIDWDEPDAYRTLVHEWAHYALSQRDTYLKPGGNDPDNYVNGISPLVGGDRVVVPKQQNTSASIMATPEGNSELGNPIDIQEGADYYPHVQIPKKAFAGPGALPLPLPIIQYDDRLRAVLNDYAPDEELIVPGTCLPDAVKNADVDHWSVFVLRPDADDAQDVERVIAQGTLDGRVQPKAENKADTGSFRLLGARPGDRVLLTHSGADGIEAFGTRIDATYQGVWAPKATDWATVNAPTEHLLLVEPEAIAAPAAQQRGADTQPTAPRIVRIKVPGTTSALAATEQAVGGAAMPAALPRVAVFPLGGAGPAQPEQDDFYGVPSLDGHIVTQLADGLLVTTYSQGGGPASAPNVPTNPITAGSADGEGLLFFDTKAAADNNAMKSKEEYATVRVVTTTSFASSADEAAGDAGTNVYGIDSNAQLPPELNPTLVILVDQGRLKRGQMPVIHRRQSTAPGAAWVPLPTYVEPGATFAATPLAAQFRNPHTQASELIGGTLLAETGPHAEYFRLFFSPPAQR